MTERQLAAAEDTEALGRELAQWLRARSGGVIYLRGPLGAGKTTLARGILRGLGIEGPIRSPTYTLLEPYEVGAKRLIHMDLYRLNSPLESEQLGLQDFPPDTTWWLVEWPERGAPLLPPADIELELSHQAGSRSARISGLA